MVHVHGQIVGPLEPRLNGDAVDGLAVTRPEQADPHAARRDVVEVHQRAAREQEERLANERGVLERAEDLVLVLAGYLVVEDHHVVPAILATCLGINGDPGGGPQPRAEAVLQSDRRGVRVLADALRRREQAHAHKEGPQASIAGRMVRAVLGQQLEQGMRQLFQASLCAVIRTGLVGDPDEALELRPGQAGLGQAGPGRFVEQPRLARQEPPQGVLDAGVLFLRHQRQECLPSQLDGLEVGGTGEHQTRRLGQRAFLTVEDLARQPHAVDAGACVRGRKQSRGQVQIHRIVLVVCERSLYRVEVVLCLVDAFGVAGPCNAPPVPTRPVALGRFQRQKIHQAPVAQPELLRGQQRAEVDRARRVAVQTGADSHEIVTAAFDLQRRAARTEQHPFVADANVLRRQAQCLEQAVGDGHLDPAHVQARPAVQRAHGVGEVFDDGAAAWRALGGQLTLFGVEVAIDDGEIDDSLVRREELVDRNDQRAKVVPDLLGRKAAEVQFVVVRVGVDQQRVVVAVISDEECAPDGLEVAEQVLDALGRDGLALDVLVDLLLAIYQAVVAVGGEVHQIASGQPTVGVQGRFALGRVQVTGHHVGAADQKLTVLGEPGFDSRKREPKRIVAILPGRRHRDAAGGFRHAETAHQLDALALEEAEDVGVQIARRGKPPTQAAPRQVARGLKQLLITGLERIGLARDDLVELGPLLGNADERGRPGLLHGPDHRCDVGVVEEMVRGAPVHAAQHLQEAAEGVEQGQKTDERVLVSDLGQRQGAGEALEHQVAVRELDTLGYAGRPRGVHDGRQIVDAHRLGACEHQRGRDVHRARAQLIEAEHRLAGGAHRIDGHDSFEVGQRLAMRVHLGQLARVGYDHRARAGVAQHESHVVHGGIRRDHHVDQAGGQAREVDQRRLDAVLAEDGDGGRPVRGIERQQCPGQELDPRGGVTPGHGPRSAASRKLEEHLRTVGLRALPEQRSNGEVRGLDRGQDSRGPCVHLGAIDALQHRGAADHVEAVPGQGTQRTIGVGSGAGEVANATVQERGDAIQRQVAQQRVHVRGGSQHLHGLAIQLP